MSFQTTKEQESFRMMVRAFAEKEIKPIAFSLDQENAFPAEQIKGLGELGVMGVAYPKEYGGAGLDYVSYAIAVEELSRVDAGTGIAVSVHSSLATWPIMAYGTEEQKKKYLVPLASGKKIGSFGLTEANAGSDPSMLETTADPDGDYYILNGGKVFNTNASKSDIYVIFAVTNPGMGLRGISAFIVEKGWEGFTFSDLYDKLGIRSSYTAELNFNNVKVPKANLLGKEGEGFRIAMQALDGGRIGVAAQAVGIAQGAFEAALAYSKERVQFGKPIAYNQVISFKLADMATKIRAARLLVYSASELKQNGQPYSMEAAMAKQYASEAGIDIANEALQIHGGAGFMKGMYVERAYRDAKICTIYEGTSEVMRTVIASHIVGKPPKEESFAKLKKGGPITGVRKKMIIKEGSAKESVAKLVELLKADGYDFTVGINIDTPISSADRVVSAGKGIGDKKNLEMIKALAHQAGAAIGCSRPVAETLKYLPLVRYVGMSGQKFTGNLYIAVGVSGAGQHLKGIKSASTIVAINNNANAPIFKNCDYGIVGDCMEIVPLLIKALDNGQPKKEAPIPKKIKRAVPKKLPPNYHVYVCNGCGYSYVQDLGDPENDVLPGTPFNMIPDEWVCPECAEEKENFI